MLQSNLPQQELITLIKDKLEEQQVHPNIRALWEEIILGLDGKNIGIPVGDVQIDKNIQIRKDMLICIGGLTGSAKSSFLDDVFVLKLFKSWLANENDDSFPNIEWIYFSMERSPLYKRAKWLCWLLYNDYGVKMSISALLSWQKGAMINEALLPYIPRLLEYLDFLEDKIDLIGGEKYNHEIKEIIASKMNRLGYHIHCNNSYDKYTGVIKGTVLVNGQVIARFNPDIYETNKLGTKKYYVDILIPQLNKGNKVVRVYENDRKYISYDPNRIVMVIFDHISKIRLKPGQNRKECNDECADNIAEDRDYYGITAIAVNQWNREIYKEDPNKCPQGIVPTELHFADSSSIIRNADLVLGIIDPIRLQDFNQAGYEVINTISDQGYCNFRSIHIIKNTYGGNGIALGFSFIGESGYFRALPSPNHMTDTLYYMTAKGLAYYDKLSFEEHINLLQ